MVDHVGSVADIHHHCWEEHVRRILAFRGRILIAAAITLVAATLTACGGSSSSSSSSSSGSTSSAPTGTGASSATSTGSGAAAAGGTLVVADATSPSSLDPDGPSSTVTSNLTAVANTYDPLVDFKPAPNPASLGGGQFIDTSGVAAKLATSWRSTNTSWTFNLRRGVRNAYGHEFTSADVVWTYQRSMGLRSTGAFILSLLSRVTGVKALGKYEVRYTTSGPSPMMLWTLTTSYLRPIDSVEAKQHITAKDPWASSWLSRNTAGFGAYDVSAYSPGQSMTLAPAPTYWGDPAKSTIKMIAVSDSSSRFSSLEKGDVNVALTLTPQQLKQAASSKDVHLFRFRGNSQVTIFPDIKLPFFRSAQVRQALQYATPSDDIIRSVYLGFGFPLRSIAPSYVYGYTDKDWPYSYATDRAKQLMRAAGYANGFSTDLYYSSDAPNLAPLATLLQSAYAQIGIKLRLVPQPTTTLVTRAFSRKDIPMYMTDTSSVALPDISDAGALWSTGGFGNVNNYSNPAFDQAYRQSFASLDNSARLPALQALQMQGAINPIAVQVNGLESVAATNPNVVGYQWDPSQAQVFKTLTVAK